ELFLGLLDEIQQACVDFDIQTGLIIGCETMSDSGRKVFSDFRFKEHVLFWTPQKRKVSYDGPFCAVVRLQYAFHIEQCRAFFSNCKLCCSANEGVGGRASKYTLKLSFLDRKKQIRGTENCKNRFTKARTDCCFA